jgi:hypothetical protein
MVGELISNRFYSVNRVKSGQVPTGGPTEGALRKPFGNGAANDYPA